MNGTEVHDPFDPDSAAADMHGGSIETMEMLNPVDIIVTDEEPDLPVRLEDVDSDEDMTGAAQGDHICSDPEADKREEHAKEAGL